MNICRDLETELQGGIKKIYFGEADTDEELNEVYKLRYLAYSSRNYIDPTKYPDGIEKDSYDIAGKCQYFFAKVEGRVIGCIRLIIDNPLPTERAFKFEEPESIKKILNDHRCEIGRFVIIPPNRERGEYLPRGLIMLFLLDTLAYFGRSRGFVGGYSFIKTSLEKKMIKFQFPIGRINSYTQTYPKDGVLYNYFNQPDDPVIPIYFITEEFFKHTQKIINNSWIFERINDRSIRLKENLYTEFLKKINII